MEAQTAVSPNLNPTDYYRMPWSLTDNAISWLEVTTACNLACKGCYRPHVGGHKTIETIKEELAVFKRERISDCISIAGGDPLVHPKIIEIVKMIRDGGWKPILNTNGLALTPKMLKELKKAGVFGFTFHVDTSQVRRDSTAKTEEEYNSLREKFADMLYAEGNIACSFNQTVSSETLWQVPHVARWAIQHPDKIHSVIFILYREPKLFGNFDFFAGTKKVNLYETYEETDRAWAGNKLIKAQDVVAKLREVDPLYEPCAYLNGTHDPKSFKWLIATRVTNGEETFGYTSPRFMQYVQEGNKILKGKYLSYAPPAFLKAGRATMTSFAPFEKGMRETLGRYTKYTVKNPTKALKPVYMQTFGIIQPIDMLADGRMNMCDGCPDITVHEGKLYWSCRLEEIKQYGCYVNCVPRAQTKEKTETPAPEVTV